MSSKKKIVVIGGGTGNFTVLRGLKKFPVHLSAIVTMSDDGGSTGVLRDELGVLPPGDVRQCLVALSTSSDLMRQLMNYRFESGGLRGHSFGNLLLSALEKVTGKFQLAVEEVSKILAIQGQVIPVTLGEVRLNMQLKSGEHLAGEKEVFLSEKILEGYESITLEPSPVANPHALEAIADADIIVIGPGGMYTSLIPNLLVEGMSGALQRAQGKKLYVANLMNRKGQTAGFKLSDYIRELSKFMDGDIFDAILVNNQRPPDDLIEAYADQGDLVENDLNDKRVLEAPLLGELTAPAKNDLMKRSLIRHSATRLASEIMQIAYNL